MGAVASAAPGGPVSCTAESAPGRAAEAGGTGRCPGSRTEGGESGRVAPACRGKREGTPGRRTPATGKACQSGNRAAERRHRTGSRATASRKCGRGTGLNAGAASPACAPAGEQYFSGHLDEFLCRRRQRNTSQAGGDVTVEQQVHFC